MAHFILGNLYREKKDFESALRYLRRASELQPGKISFLMYLGEAYQEKGDYTEAIGVYEKVIALRGDLGEAYARIGVIYAELDEPEAALRHFEEAFRLNPGLQALPRYRSAYEELTSQGIEKKGF
jgi:tetratricopeptide (TPR) repeat protein